MIRGSSRASPCYTEAMDADALSLLAVRGLPVGLLGFDAAGACVSANPAWCSQSRVAAERALARGWLDSVHLSDRGRVEAALAGVLETGEEVTIEYRVESGEDAPTWLLSHFAPVREEGRGEVSGYVAVTFDVTSRTRDEADKRTLAQRVALTERLASLGTLSAGIGHEINNPLAALFMSLDHAAARLEAAKAELGGAAPRALLETEAVLREARVAADRIGRIVRGVMTLAPPRDHDSTRECRIQDAIDRVLAMSSHAFGARIKLVRDFRPTPRVFADPIGLSQVFLNLVVNAVEAIQSSGGTGTIRVATYLGDQGEVVAEIEDDGPGVEPGTKERIFDPFFTTKPPGYTGLGLAVSHELVRGLGGTLELVDPTRGGARFRLTLPAAELPHDEAGEGRRLRVLLIEEEYGLLIALKRAFGDRFLVATERDAPTALARLRRGERFDAILIGVVMTDLSVPEVYRSIAELDEAQARRVAFLIGLPVGTETEQFLESFSDRLVPLSARPHELQQAIRDVARR